MMTYVLIMCAVIRGVSTSCVTQEFNSYFTCADARDDIKTVYETVTYQQISAVCVKK